MTSVDSNPYSAPRSDGNSEVFASRTRYVGRSLIAGLLAASTALTAALTGGLWVLGDINLGQYGFVFLGSLAVATFFLVIAARCYLAGSRRSAIGCATLAPCMILFAVLLALNDAGVITLF